MLREVIGKLRVRRSLYGARRARTARVSGTAITSRTGRRNSAARLSRLSCAARSCAWTSTRVRSTSIRSTSSSESSTMSAARRSPLPTGTSRLGVQRGCAPRTIACASPSCPESRRLTDALGYRRQPSSAPQAAASRHRVSSVLRSLPRSTRLTSCWVTIARRASCRCVSPAVMRASRSSLPNLAARRRDRARPTSTAFARKLLTRGRLMAASYWRLTPALSTSAPMGRETARPAPFDPGGECHGAAASAPALMHTWCV